MQVLDDIAKCIYLLLCCHSEPQSDTLYTLQMFENILEKPDTFFVAVRKLYSLWWYSDSVGIVNSKSNKG